MNSLSETGGGFSPNYQIQNPSTWCRVTDRPPLRAGTVAPELPVPASIPRPPYTNDKQAPGWCNDYMINDVEVGRTCYPHITLGQPCQPCRP